MPIGPGLYTYLQSKAAITAVVGTRVYPMRSPQGSSNYPCISYQTISSRSTYSHSGDNQLRFERVQINCFARTAKAAKDLAELVRLSLSGYAGLMGSTAVQSCFLENERDIAYESADTEAQDVLCVQVDYMIAYTEAAPTL